MHEHSLACSIAEICQESAQANHLVVISRVILAAGPLAAVSEDTLSFIFGEVAAQHGIGTPQLVFLKKPLVVKCRACSAKTELEAPTGGFCELWHNPQGEALPETCPVCGSRDIEYPGATLFEVESLEGELSDAASG
jgi:Zn finger protein HypA/HybF involved in hydrogenase expression